MDFLSQVIKDSKNEFASLASDGIAAGDVESFVDTGSYIFNALVSGSIFGGIPSNKITALAGESGTGKTFFCLSVVRNFLDFFDFIFSETGTEIFVSVELGFGAGHFFQNLNY